MCIGTAIVSLTYWYGVSLAAIYMYHIYALMHATSGRRGAGPKAPPAAQAAVLKVPPAAVERTGTTCVLLPAGPKLL